MLCRKIPEIYAVKKLSVQTLNTGNDVHMCLICKTEEETRSLFDKLSAGGKADQPLNEMFFGLTGTLSDKFGKRWILECDIKNIKGEIT